MLATTTPKPSSNNVVRIADQMLDRVEAAAFIRASIGVPIEPLDLERHAKAGSGPIFRRWGRKPLYRRSDLIAWAADRLSPPIIPWAG
jgi:hypothetical protein